MPWTFSSSYCCVSNVSCPSVVSFHLSVPLVAFYDAPNRVQHVLVSYLSFHLRALWPLQRWAKGRRRFQGKTGKPGMFSRTRFPLPLWKKILLDLWCCWNTCSWLECVANWVWSTKLMRLWVELKEGKIEIPIMWSYFDMFAFFTKLNLLLRSIHFIRGSRFPDFYSECTDCVESLPIDGNSAVHSIHRFEKRKRFVAGVHLLLFVNTLLRPNVVAFIL